MKDEQNTGMTLDEVVKTALTEMGLTKEQVKRQLTFANIMAGNVGGKMKVKSGLERDCIEAFKRLFKGAASDPKSIGAMMARDLHNTLQNN